MRRFFLIFIACQLIMLAQAQVNLDSTAVKNLDLQAKKMAEAFVKEDYKTFIKYTHPVIVRSMGSGDKAVATLKQSIDEMKKQGFGFRSITIGAPLQSAKAGNEIHVIIPQTLNLNAPGGYLVSESYLLGITKDKGKNWLFIDAAKLTDETVKKILPNYNSELKIPSPGKPVFHKE